MQIEKTLELLGLKGKQARVYLAALELGSAPANEIAKRAEIQRTTAYEILDDLVGNGLLSTSQKGRVKVYVAEPPQKLLTREEEKTRRLRQVLPELESIFGSAEARPRVRFYEGVEGIKTVFEDTLKSKEKKLDAILSVQDVEEVVGSEWFEEYARRRVATGSMLRVMRSEATEVGDKFPSSAKELRTVHYSPRDMVFNLTIYVYDNKVSLIGTRRENFGMIIESADFHQSMQHLFDTLWQVTRVGKRVDERLLRPA